MIETAVALILAHVMADFLFQPDWMARGKNRFGPLALHSLIVLATAQLAIGFPAPELAALALAHMAIDAVKAKLRPTALAFLIDQSAHTLCILVAAALLPDLWANGIWARHIPIMHQDIVLHAMLIAAGLAACVQGGGYAVGLLMKPFAYRIPQSGLANAGKLIGMLERALIFLFVLTGQAAGIGFLIGAKSILRFSTASKDQKASEYVIIGTLASFGWALGIAMLTDWGGTLLPPLEIIAPRP